MAGNGQRELTMAGNGVLDLLAVLEDDEGGEAVDPVAGAQLPGGYVRGAGGAGGVRGAGGSVRI